MAVGAGSAGDAQQRRRALRSAGGPVLAQFAGELLACRGPVGLDVLAEVLDVALQVELVLLEPADVELLSRGAALKLS